MARPNQHPAWRGSASGTNQAQQVRALWTIASELHELNQHLSDREDSDDE